MYSVELLVVVGVFAVCAGISGCLCIAYLWLWADKSESSCSQMSAKIDSLEAEITNLKNDLEGSRANGQKRHTHNTAAGLEDALAIAIDVIEEYASSQRYTQARIGQLQAALKKVREGPYAYNPETPAGKRPARRPNGGDV